MARGAQLVRDLVGGRPDGCIVDAAHRHIEATDLRQAEAWRASGRSWQTIANCLRLNQTDLMAACGALPVVTTPEPRACVAAGPRVWGPRVAQRSKPLRVLAAILDGAASHAEIAALADVAAPYVGVLLARLKRAGELLGAGPAEWRVTPLGRGRLERAARDA